MSLLPSRAPKTASSVALGREELLAMAGPEAAEAYQAARGSLKRAEATEVLIVVLVLAAILALVVGVILAAPVLLVAAVPAVIARGNVRRRYAAALERGRAAAEWERPRHRVEVEAGPQDVSVAVVSCTLDHHGAHRAVVEGGVAMGETAAHEQRRVPAGEDVTLHETVAELEARVDERELAAREAHAELTVRAEDRATDAVVLDHVRSTAGRWR